MVYFRLTNPIRKQNSTNRYRSTTTSSCSVCVKMLRIAPPPLALLTELDEYTQVEPVLDANGEDAADSGREAEPVPWGRLMRLSGGSAIALMPRPEQPQGRALNEVTLGRGKVSIISSCFLSSRMVVRSPHPTCQETNEQTSAVFIFLSTIFRCRQGTDMFP